MTPLMRIALVVLFALTTMFGQATEGKPIADLAWLAGSWQLDSNGQRIEEYWTAPVGGAMLGLSRTVAHGKTVEFEFLRIEQRGDDLVYIAQPGGRPPTEFKLERAASDEWVFANPTHDFPKKIRYRHIGTDSLTASIEDATGAKRMDFPYKRVAACDGNSPEKSGN